MTNNEQTPAAESVKCLCLQMPAHFLFLVYVERSTDVPANEKVGRENETPDAL